MVRKYDPKSAQKLGRELDVDGLTAVRIAATTMDGAATTSTGGIDATQTYCNKLHFDESLSPSEGQEEGRQITTEAIYQFVKEEGIKLEPGEDPAAAWLRLNSGPELAKKKR